MKWVLFLALACTPPDAPAAAPVPELAIAPPVEPAVQVPAEVVWSPRIRALTEAERAAMIGVSWREGCPVGLDALAVVELSHHTPGGEAARGELVVHANVADDVVAVFAELWQARFPITRMKPIHHFGGDDASSMAADNTSGFNCRPVGRSQTWSEHAYGRAIDINPLRNPYVRGERVDPPEGRDWLVRDATRPGVIVSGGPAVDAFAARGWRWGGHWSRSKDYQHFSSTGR